MESPVRVAVANDYELVVAGVAAMLEHYRDRVRVVDAVVAGRPVTAPTDVVLLDTFGRADDGVGAVKEMLDTPNVRRVCVYTLTPRPAMVDTVLDAGASGVIAKSRPASALVDAIERINNGEQVVDGRPGHGTPNDWPGADYGLTARQSEVVALLLQGLSNAEIGEALYVDVNTVKTHLRHAYRALGVRSRAQALAMLLGDPEFGRRSTNRPFGRRPGS